MSEIPTHCLFIQFSGLEDVFQMLGDGAAALVDRAKEKRGIGQSALQCFNPLFPQHRHRHHVLENLPLPHALAQQALLLHADLDGAYSNAILPALQTRGGASF
jgi:hypothetical protein